MERLPDELVAYVFDYVQAAHALSTAMVVSRRWYMYGARNLHARLVLSLGIDMSFESEDTALSLMKRLVSPTLSTAHCIRHLFVFGLARVEVHNLLLDILQRATGLRSLDIHGLHLMHDGAFFPTDSFSAPGFLPSLVALNVGSAPYLASLARSRRLHALRVHEPIDDALLRGITVSNGSLAGSIQCLELVVSAETSATAVDQLKYLASALEKAPLYALALQFVLPIQAGPMSWPDFEDTIGRMGPFLRTFGNLTVLGLVIRPDPIMHASSSAEHGSGEQQRERMTRTLAERLIADHGLSRLKRIELRWHGWRVQDGQLLPVARPDFLRLPQNWLYKPSGVGFP